MTNHPIGAGWVVADILGFWALLAVIGLPLTVACLPHARRSLAILIAPIAAIAGLSSLSHLTFFTLHQPYRPLLTYGTFFISSAALLVARYPRPWIRNGRGLAKDTEGVWPFLIVPLLFVLLFGSLFLTNGLLLFSAAEDELGYIDVARQIMEHLNTHDILDVPWPRPDHLLTDTAGHSLAYVPSARLGAFVLLADMSRLFKLPLELTFPLLVGTTLAIGLAAIGIIRLQLKGKGFPLIAAQAGLASSFLLLMLHFQGSLSSIVALSFRIGGLAIVLWAVSLRRGWWPMVLAVVITSGWLPVYIESFGIGFCVPVFVAVAINVLIRYRKDRQGGSKILLRSVALIVSVCVIHPDLVIDTFLRYHEQVSSLDMSLFWADPYTFTEKFFYFMDYILLPVIGAASLYDNSYANLRFGQIAMPYMFYAMIVMTLFSAVGFSTRLRSVSLAAAWAVLAVALVSMSVVAGFGQASVASNRGAQWFIPLGILGLSLLAFGKPRPDALFKGRMDVTLKIIATSTWIVFVGSNSNSVVRTILHVNGHTRETEPTIRYLDSSRTPWPSLRALVNDSARNPVLMSGFRNTPLSHTIGEGLRNTPILLGESITSYWVGIDPMNQNYPTFIQKYAKYWDSEEDATAKLAGQPISKLRWPGTYSKLLAETVRAIVPNGGAYPSEWGPRGSLFGTRSMRFVNLCDVVDRTGSDLELSSGQVAARTDASGVYWTADGPFTIRPVGAIKGKAIVSIVFDGAPPKEIVSEDQSPGSVAPQAGTNHFTWEATINPEPGETLTVTVQPDTKLRSIDLYRQTSE